MDGSFGGGEGLPGEFPVFPLAGALLLPHGKLPLNIFEPRYLALVEDSLAGRRMFGMVQPDPQRPASQNGPGLFTVGCIGRMSSFSETDDGRYLISLSGLIRFDITAELDTVRGYRRVSGNFSRFLNDMGPPPPIASAQRRDVLTALRSYFTANGFDANWSAIEAMDDAELVVTLCMVCPFEPVEKQALLEAADSDERTGTLLTLLRMGMQQAGTRPQ